MDPITEDEYKIDLCIKKEKNSKREMMDGFTPQVPCLLARGLPLDPGNLLIQAVEANICNAFKSNILKYGGTYGDNRVIPLVLCFNGTMYDKSINLLSTRDYRLFPKQTLLPYCGTLMKKPSCVTSV
ncbi:Hypothetical_protein [Hexamita inflata]|uniref:Hypothetical_protein n=1 Tax=Hexamita inflata TaxID=28002 RepID=A0AA86TQP5_9EUKA|nr:Hypothetical protein HINF_LOCUS2302 [Hexamita inflata]CAI9919648.1 Hypothetical protein HINF_LOCUS7293 [Hexamita inflata]